MVAGSTWQTDASVLGLAGQGARDRGDQPVRRGLVSATGGSDLWVGGDFTKVNGVGQQGLTRFTNLGPGARGCPLAWVRTCG
ncbi:hypothetical protein AB0E63_05820 [Kribbella sp. NPDC026596]|uniref:hypothetical protein n=1 Tax=Kribbella sp. NPDC026596 TaxID=3155122 RepID=UPI0033CDAEB1